MCFVRNLFKFKPYALHVPTDLKRSDYQEEIRELNLAHLMLAQKMLKEDRETAMFRLGIGDAVADVLSGLSAARLVRMASCQMVLAALRFDDVLLTGLLAGEGRDAASSSIHAAIVAAGKPPEELS